MFSEHKCLCLTRAQRRPYLKAHSFVQFCSFCLFLFTVTVLLCNCIMLWLLFSGDLWVSSFVFILPLWEHACFSLAMFIERNKSTNVNLSATNKVSTNWVNIFNRTFMSSVNFFKVVNQIDVRRPRTSASVADVILIMLTSTIKLRHLRLLIFKWCNNGGIFCMVQLVFEKKGAFYWYRNGNGRCPL